MKYGRYPCGQRFPEFSEEEKRLNIPEFMSDSKRIRMDLVLRKSYKKNMQRFEKWRIKYLRYIEAQYPLLYNFKTP